MKLLRYSKISNKGLNVKRLINVIFVVRINFIVGLAVCEVEIDFFVDFGMFDV